MIYIDKRTNELVRRHMESFNLPWTHYIDDQIIKAWAESDEAFTEMAKAITEILGPVYKKIGLQK